MQDYLKRHIERVLAAMEADRAADAGDDATGLPEGTEVEFEQPANPEHGDLATNVALRLAGHFRKAPRAIADEIRQRLVAVPLDPNRVASVEVAGPGFLNFRFASSWLADSLAGILEEGEAFGRTRPDGTGAPDDATGPDGAAAPTALVEFVSANPTGPLTVGHGRNAVLGDTLANLLEWCGYDVTREYYFNDAGRQMRILAESVRARYLALVDTHIPRKMIGEGEDALEVPEPFPEDGYRGDYIIDIASHIASEHGPDLGADDDLTVFKKTAEKMIFADIEATLDRLGISMDSYFNERALYDSGRVWQIVNTLKEKDLAYEKDGAVWFRTTEFGKEKDTVLVKSSGEPTYRLPDIGYHADKLDRDFDRIVDIFGADHIATFPDVLSGVESLGYDPERIDVVIYQFVTLVRGGEPVKMSTRKATYVTLDELMDEVGEDVTRYFFLMRSPNTHLEFDLDLAREASEKNPVFYLQYAHARICSILRKAEEVGFTFDKQADLSLLTHESEEALIKVLLGLPDAIHRAADTYEPHRLANYLRDVAVAFTQFYGDCRIVGEQEALATARMKLAVATRQVLRNGLTILGISAPDRM